MGRRPSFCLALCRHMPVNRHAKLGHIRELLVKSITWASVAGTHCCAVTMHDDCSRPTGNRDTLLRYPVASMMLALVGIRRIHCSCRCLVRADAYGRKGQHTKYSSVWSKHRQPMRPEAIRQFSQGPVKIGWTRAMDGTCCSALRSTTGRIDVAIANPRIFRQQART